MGPHSLVSELSHDGWRGAPRAAVWTCTDDRPDAILYLSAKLCKLVSGGLVGFSECEVSS